MIYGHAEEHVDGKMSDRHSVELCSAVKSCKRFRNGNDEH